MSVRRVHHVESYGTSTATSCKMQAAPGMLRASGGDWDLVTCKACLKRKPKRSPDEWSAGHESGRKFEETRFHLVMNQFGIPGSEEFVPARVRLGRTMVRLKNTMRRLQTVSQELENLKTSNADLRARIVAAHKALA